MFPNPVNGYIHPKGWVRPSGNVEPVVTRTAADHIAIQQGVALDISTRRCNLDPVLAIHAGKVILRDDTQGILVLDHGDGWRSHYAHMRDIRFGSGQMVPLGARLGMISDAHDPSVLNFSGCHLHFGITQWLDGAWVKHDPWTLLSQNQEQDDMSTTITMYPAKRKWSTKGGTLVGRRLNPPPLTKSGSFAAGSSAEADAEYQITPTPTGWPAGPYQRVTNGHFAGYLVANSEVNLGPVPVCPPSGGFTQEDMDRARKEGAEAAAQAAQSTADALP